MMRYCKDEIEFICSKLACKGKDAIVADKRLESASKIVTIEPVNHVSTVACTKSHCS